MQPEQPAKKVVPPSKKYNYEAMASYNFDKIDFDIDFGEVDEKKHQEIVKKAQDADREDEEAHKAKK